LFPQHENDTSSFISDVSQSENFYESIFKYLSVPFAVLDKNGKLVRTNPAFLELLSATPQTNRQRTLLDFAPIKEKAKLAEALSGLNTKQTQTVVCETALVDGFGFEKRVGIVLNPLPGSDLLLACLFDKSQVCSGCDVARTTNELENLFLLISHNLKSPIVAIQGFTKLLLEHAAARDQEELRHYFERIQKNTTRLEKMVNNLLNYSKLAAKPLEAKEVSLNQVVTQVLIENHFRFKEKNIRVKFAEDLPAVRGDAESLAMLYFNLVDNSIKYIGNARPAEIEIGWEAKPRFYVFRVKDNGIGVAEEYQDKIFEVFQRGGAPAEIEGSGLGLAMVKRIVENHGGVIRMTSRVGAGTTVYFTLPKITA